MSPAQNDTSYLNPADLQDKKTFLANKLIEFQKKIAEQAHEIEQQKLDNISEKKAFFLDLLDVIDGFDTFFENIQEREEGFDKAVKMMVRNVRSIQKKSIRVLKKQNIVPMEFPDGKARMGKCKVVETVDKPDMEDGDIYSVVKNGYINQVTGEVIRYAEVITVKHEE